MKNLKKTLLVLSLFSAVLLAGTACGKQNTSSSDSSIADTSSITADTEDTKDTNIPDSENSAETVQSTEAPAYDGKEDIQKLDGTVWSGLDAKQVVYAIEFAKEKIHFSTNDGKDFEGFWDTKDDGRTIQLFSDESHTKEIFSFEWKYVPENDVLILNQEIILTKAANGNASEVLKKNSASLALLQALQAKFWLCKEEASANVVHVDGNMLKFVSFTKEGELTEREYYWSADETALVLYDGMYQKTDSLKWELVPDKTITLSNEEGQKAYTPLEEEQAKNLKETLCALFEIQEEQVTEMPVYDDAKHIDQDGNVIVDAGIAQDTPQETVLVLEMDSADQGGDDYSLYFDETKWSGTDADGNQVRFAFDGEVASVTLANNDNSYQWTAGETALVLGHDGKTEITYHWKESDDGTQLTLEGTDGSVLHLTAE